MSAAVHVLKALKIYADSSEQMNVKDAEAYFNDFTAHLELLLDTHCDPDTADTIKCELNDWLATRTPTSIFESVENAASRDWRLDDAQVMDKSSRRGRELVDGR